MTSCFPGNVPSVKIGSLDLIISLWISCFNHSFPFNSSGETKCQENCIFLTTGVLLLLVSDYVVVNDVFLLVCLLETESQTPDSSWATLKGECHGQGVCFLSGFLEIRWLLLSVILPFNCVYVTVSYGVWEFCGVFANKGSLNTRFLRVQAFPFPL